MSQVNKGIRTILENPKIYQFLQSLISKEDTRPRIIRDYLKLEPGMKVLDVGCGPADILGQIKCPINYTGIDFEGAYIDYAKERYGDKGTFIKADVSTYEFPFNTKFDRVLLFAIQHHLEDEGVRNILRRASTLLGEDGFFIGLENVYIEKQNPIARKLISLDRGKNVRTTEGYRKLAEEFFEKVEIDIVHDMLKIPYTILMMKCSKPKIIEVKL